MKRYEYDGKPGDTYYLLAVWYDLDRHEWGAPDKELRAILGPCDGAGTGLGQRDMDWAFADRKSADKALELVKRVIADREGFYCSLDELRAEELSDD